MPECQGQVIKGGYRRTCSLHTLPPPPSLRPGGESGDRRGLHKSQQRTTAVLITAHTFGVYAAPPCRPVVRGRLQGLNGRRPGRLEGSSGREALGTRHHDGFTRRTCCVCSEDRVAEGARAAESSERRGSMRSLGENPNRRS
jgi:hypothetical protein